jgi:hypothetical protein
VNRPGPSLPTRVGHAEWGDNRFRGYSVARDLAGRESIAGLLALAIVGRRFDSNDRMMLDEIATATNVADPRIWPLKLVRVASAYGGHLAAMAAATVCLGGASVGEESAGRAAQFLVELRDALLAAGADPMQADDRIWEEHSRRSFAQSRPVGFDVPFRVRDERVEILTQRVAARGRSELPYWRFFEKAADTLWRIHNVRPNMTLAVGAICLDMGLTPREIGPLTTAIGTAGYWANACEGAQQKPPSLQALPDSCVRYTGPPPRVTPRARGRC